MALQEVPGRALAVATRSAYASKVRGLERVLFDLMGVHFSEVIPFSGTVERHHIYEFILHR